jgi:hypothetical protein
MIFPCEPRGTARESNHDDQLHRGPFPPRDHPHGGPVVCGVALEVPPWRSAAGGTRRCRRPRDPPTLGRAIPSRVGRRVSSPEALGVREWADGRDVRESEGAVALSVAGGTTCRRRSRSTGVRPMKRPSRATMPRMAPRSPCARSNICIRSWNRIIEPSNAPRVPG